ncbi:anion permease [Chryseobacterium sp. MYb7]|uniref:inorganic phosphate transporter n=1 Tax=Chryseobacterium sp. MYb7 TaxID=1827290 RepID=UPI000D002718|nr:inorganic phosphate transporter [Chryseobacterium sp. MYb7]PRA97715.1 anion permease [Chryseobacterium sp. MYb7]
MLLNNILFFSVDPDLSTGLVIIFILCLVAVVAFEFVNGFHDTANAVATIIYTKALKPVIAIPWSGFWNFLGVFTGGIAVAMGILKLVPMDTLITLPIAVGASLVLAVLLASIIWNLGTWYFGIPCSSSHTLIGALIGAGLGFTWYYGGGVNWHKAEEIGMSLILSPIVGFCLAVLLMWFFKYIIRYKALFHIPEGANDKPPFAIRAILVTTCTLVSFFHGSNDGQKGVGLFMLILIAFMPAQFAINHDIPNDKIISILNTTEHTLQAAAAQNTQNTAEFKTLNLAVENVKENLIHKNEKDKAATYRFRKQVDNLVDSLKKLNENKAIAIDESSRAILSSQISELKKLTEFAPLWVIIIISVSLGLGTTIGWKRIAVTIGEKIGNEHLNYAQGASSEIVAASTIGISTFLGLPVSTTHVLSSGIAGSMVASGGKSNLNPATLKSIGLAWVLTLPVSIVLSLLLFICFHLFI